MYFLWIARYSIKKRTCLTLVLYYAIPVLASLRTASLCLSICHMLGQILPDWCYVGKAISSITPASIEHDLRACWGAPKHKVIKMSSKYMYYLEARWLDFSGGKQGNSTKLRYVGYFLMCACVFRKYVLPEGLTKKTSPNCETNKLFWLSSVVQWM